MGTGHGRAIRGGFGCRPENLTHVEGTVGGMWKLMKKGAEMTRQKEINKSMQGVQPTPGRYHRTGPSRTRPFRSPREDRTACGRPQTNRCSLNSGLHVEACCFTPSRAIAGRAVMIEFVASRSNEWCSFAATLVLP